MLLAVDSTGNSCPGLYAAVGEEGWVRVGTSLALWGLLPLVVGWLRIERSEIA